MKVRDAIIDDQGQRWEILAAHDTHFKRDANGEVVRGADGDHIWETVVREFAYRKEGDQEWLSLPPWADVRDEWKINLCYFYEDEETGEMTFWEVAA